MLLCAVCAVPIQALRQHLGRQCLRESQRLATCDIRSCLSDSADALTAPPGSRSSSCPISPAKSAVTESPAAVTSHCFCWALQPTSCDSPCKAAQRPRTWCMHGHGSRASLADETQRLVKLCLLGSCFTTHACTRNWNCAHTAGLSAVTQPNLLCSCCCTAGQRFQGHQYLPASPQRC
jgi:hypothetical protein